MAVGLRLDCIVQLKICIALVYLDQFHILFSCLNNGSVKYELCKCNCKCKFEITETGERVHHH